MHHETQLVYSVSLARQAVFAYWRRSVGLATPVVLVLVTADLIGLLMLGDSSWVVGVLAASVFIAVCFYGALYAVHLHNALMKLRDMRKPLAEMRADERGLTIATETATSSVEWSMICEVWRFPSFWLLFFSKSHFMTVPISCVPPDMQAFLLQRIGACGGKILD